MAGQQARILVVADVDRARVGLQRASRRGVVDAVERLVEQRLPPGRESSATTTICARTADSWPNPQPSTENSSALVESVVGSRPRTRPRLQFVDRDQLLLGFFRWLRQNEVLETSPIIGLARESRAA